MTRFKIAAAQYELSYLKSFAEWKEKSRDLVKQSSDRGAQVIVFPELCSLEIASFFSADIRNHSLSCFKEVYNYSSEYIEFWMNLAREFKVYICAPSLCTLDHHRVYFFSPYGSYGHQDKNTNSSIENEMNLKDRDFSLSLLDTDYGTFAIQISTDIFQPAFSSFLKAHGATAILVPAATNHTADSNKIHLAARSRAMETHCLTIVSQTIGALPWSKILKTNTGFSAIYSPIGEPFSDDGRLERGKINSTEWVFTEVDFSKLSQYRKNNEPSPLLKPPRTSLQFFNLKRP